MGTVSERAVDQIIQAITIWNSQHLIPLQDAGATDSSKIGIPFLSKGLSKLKTGFRQPLAFLRLAAEARRLAWQKILLMGVLVAVISMSAHAVQTSDYAVQVSATVKISPPQITLTWPQDSSGASSSYVVSRKHSDAAFWGAGVSLPGTATSYTDLDVSIASAYEYQVKRVASGYTGFGYVCAGIEIPATESRGKILLIVENTHAADLANELARLEQDLVGDGWIVLRHEVARTDSVGSIKELIRADYSADPASVKSVFLFGRVPVPYSGNRAVDGHPEHLGAWPADVFYADMDGTWTDTSVNSTGASSPRNHNVPGDGKFDQSQMPAPLKLQIGRVDLSDLPAFSLSEKELLRQYLNKDHNFRHKLLNVDRRGLIVDGFGVFNGEAFAASGWRNFAPLFGSANLTSGTPGEFISTLSSQSYLWAYGCGPGTYTSAVGLGTTADLASNDLQAVFTMLFGSYFADWDSSDNFMRAVLASPTHGLACSWVGRPNWFAHHMGLGQPIGFSALVSQNNLGTYQKLNFGAGEIHVALMGDPTLRLHSVAPPAGLSATAENRSVTLTWSSSPDAVLGYNIYRAAKPAGPFTRVNATPIGTTTFTDFGVDPGTYSYEVRAEKVETSGSGSYYNLSQGVFVSATVPSDSESHPLTVLGVVAADADASELGPDPGAFLIVLSWGLPTDLTISLEFGGSATEGVDYLTVPATLTIPAGATEIPVRIFPIPDSVIEGNETVTLTVIPELPVRFDSGTDVATISITDGPAVQRLKVRRR